MTRDGCTCQYGPDTPKWYINVKTCPVHAAEYNAGLAPEWWDVAANDLKANRRWWRQWTRR